jgi:hypothetical protein
VIKRTNKEKQEIALLIFNPLICIGIATLIGSIWIRQMVWGALILFIVGIYRSITNTFKYLKGVSDD